MEPDIKDRDNNSHLPCI